MKRTFMGIPVIAMLGVGLLLAGCGEQAANGSTSGSTSSQDAAKSAFLAERGNGTPGATSSGTAVAGGQGGRPPGVFGAVEKVDGNNITVKSQVDGSDTVIQLASGATVRKQADAQASDIKAGETISAIGNKSGDTLDARSVQIGNGGFGAFGGFGGGNGAGRGFRGNNGTPEPQGNGGFGNGASPNGTPRAGFGSGGGRFRGNNGTPGVAPDFVAGTVAKVDGNSVTVTMSDGTSGTFTISSSTRLQKEVDIQATDLKTGDNLVATGQQNGNVFEATALQVIDRVPGTGAGAGAAAGQTPTP